MGTSPSPDTVAAMTAMGRQRSSVVQPLNFRNRFNTVIRLRPRHNLYGSEITN